MSDSVDTIVLENNAVYYMARFTNDSDGTGESAVVKVDRSALASFKGVEPKRLNIEWIEYSIYGFNFVKLLWDATTDDEIAVLSGNGFKDYREGGGLRDPRSAGNVGDVLLTTDGAFDGASYDITILFKLEA